MKQAFGLPPLGRTTAHDFMPTSRVNRTYGRQLNDGIAATLVRIRDEEWENTPDPPETTHQSSGLSDEDDISNNDYDKLSSEDDNIPMFLDEEDDISGNDFSDNKQNESEITSNIVPNLGQASSKTCIMG